MTTWLNPLHLSGEDARTFYLLVDNNRKPKWSAHKPYFITGLKGKEEIRLTHTLARRSRKNEKDDAFEIISHTEVGAGIRGTVLDIPGKLIEQNDCLVFKKHKKDWVAKKQTHDKDEPDKTAINEHRLLTLAGHIDLKNMTWAKKTSYIFMEKRHGEELFDIIKDDLENERILSPEERWQLFMGVLHAVNDQVTQRGILHRDIKPENIRVDMREQPPKITIIDFGLGATTENSHDDFVGTFGYVAPEITENTRQTVQVDVFSCARVLALLFHIDTESYDIADNTSITPSTLPKLFTGIHGFSYQNRQDIRAILLDMLKPDPLERITLAEAIARFEKIIPDFRIQKLPRKVSEHEVDLWDTLETQITLLRKKAARLRRRGDVAASDSMKLLAQQLEDKYTFIQDNFEVADTADIVQEVSECKQLIRHAKPELEEHRNCRYILANIALALAGLGVFYLAIAAATRKSRDSFLFFGQTQSAQLAEQVENTLTHVARCA